MASVMSRNPLRIPCFQGCPTLSPHSRGFKGGLPAYLEAWVTLCYFQLTGAIIFPWWLLTWDLVFPLILFFFFHFFSTSSCFCSLVWPLLPWSPVCSFANPKAQRPKEESFIFACIVFFCGEVWGVGGGWVARLSSVQSLSHVQLFATPWTTACQASLSITNSRSPHKPMSTESVMPSNHLILHRPLLLLPSIFPSIRVLSNESALCIRWAKYWNFSYNISPSNEYPELISFGMDWLDLVAVQGTLKSRLQHHSSKASILLHSTFFIV